MWYIPTVCRPAVEAPAFSPIEKKAMSWWLFEAGARRNTNAPPASSMTVEKPSTSR
jgi:hypothetical protein